jgi:hypothetical protein
MRLLDKPEHWRKRAKKVRELAEGITAPAAKRTMREIADEYDELTKRAKKREMRVRLSQV